MKNLIYQILFWTLTIILLVVISSCQKENSLISNSEAGKNPSISNYRNIQPFENLQPPKPTVKLKKYNNYASRGSRELTTSLLPEKIQQVIAPGESMIVDDMATITLPIERGDIIFMFDLTKSMLQEVANVKVNSQNIMGAISSVINDVNFGVVSHMDYIGTYNYCGYEDRYGGESYGDYPYQLNRSITYDTSLVSNAINSLDIGWGWDYPENYARVLYELSADDAGIGWRSNAKKIVVAWLDNQPHDCGLGTGPDPGRDEIVNTSDDLEIYPVLNELADKGIVLFVLYSGGDPLGGDHLEIWEEFCEITGGAAFRINQDGTIPDEVEIDEYIKAIIDEEISHIDHLTLEACDPEFESWITNVTPSEYTDINDSGSFPFTLEITVPAGTENGLYEFDICLVGDGYQFASQHVKIRVFDGLAVPFDIRPDGCPNPFNIHYTGVIPAAILAFPGFNVSSIDVSSINIDGVYPTSIVQSDVAKPYYPFLNKELDEWSCYNLQGKDGLKDLNLKFDNLEIAALFDGFVDGELVKVYISGKLLDGTDILGEDVIRIVDNLDMQMNPK